eukprot:INCI3878.1.p1 GENE.INCI3878.1~~INCI3878.1.p1  ORF type:complete len:717 (+),score=97.93 INCI3878.1:225-2153(+)
MNIEGCKAVCDATVGCGGFNYPHGILKKTDCGEKMSSEGAVSLYLKKDTPQPPPPSPAWGNVWPIPANISMPGGVPAGSNTSSFPLKVAENITIVSNITSARLARGIERYSAILQRSSSNGPPCNKNCDRTLDSKQTAVVSTLSLEIESEDARLTSSTDYSYTLEILENGTANARAATIYGAMYAMETFSQLGDFDQMPTGEASGALYINASSVFIVDSPSYLHRGFMADTGRRFWPVATIKAVLDAMSWFKMNVLHLHLSDNCRYAVESDSYPSLTARLTGMLGGFYSKDDVADILAYAADRGIRVIPEVDMPGHAQGLQGLGGGGGLVFCDEGGAGSTGVPFADLRNDAAGQSIQTAQGIYTELAQLFPDAEELFIGADETSPNGPCTVKDDYVPIEKTLCDHITTNLSRTVGGWEEYAFETKVAQPWSPSNAFVVNTWHYHTQAEAVAAGFRTVAANDSHFYLLYGQPWEAYWVDLADGFSGNATQLALLNGGVVSAWGDEYCYVAYCIHLDKFPSAHALFPPSADALFHESILGVAFPRTAVAAGSFWNFEGFADLKSLSVAVDILNARMIQRGLPSCPDDCSCDAASRCGQQYANESLSTVPAAQTLKLDELLELRSKGMADRARQLQMRHPTRPHS